MKILFISSFILMTFLSSPALADCIYNGREYPQGSQVDGYVCHGDGTWKKQS
ncbi:MAG: hypothetical protein AAFO95_09250 [Cyanobacteria bacterium J06600_6]